jgi:hypothetical protein
MTALLDSARVSRACDGILAIAGFPTYSIHSQFRRSREDCFGKGSETNARDACPTLPITTDAAPGWVAPAVLPQACQ